MEDVGRPLKQEQEPASEEVTEVAPGVLRLQIPINFDGLGHVNTYALVDGRGAAIVDPGMPGMASWRALRTRLKTAEIPLQRVHTVIVTHSHPDHFGGAGRLAKEAGAELVTHRAFATWGSRRRSHEGHCGDEDAADDLAADADADAGPGIWNRVTPWGERAPRPPRRHMLGFMAARAGVNPYFVQPRPTRRLSDGEVVSLAGREWLCVHTPGHTLDHLCLYDPAGRVLLAGDHVLPTITPHVPGLGAGPDPLAGFLASLDKVCAVGDIGRALPAHGHPFADVPGRVAAIKAHHEGRLGKLREASAALGPATVTELSHQLFRPARWGPMAKSETYAHLEHLRLDGQAERREGGGKLVYLIDTSSTASAPA